MTIQKYEGKTKEEAIEKAKAELGDAVVIMNVRKVRPSGLMGIFQSGTVEVTVAIEDDLLSRNKPQVAVRSAIETLSSGKGFTAVADEAITVPPPAPTPVPEPAPVAAANTTTVQRTARVATERRNPQIIYEKEPGPSVSALDTDALRDAFKEVGDLIGKDRTIPVSSVSGYDPEAKLIKAEQFKKEPKPAEKITPFPKNKEQQPTKLFTSDRNTNFIRVLYNNLIEHEVDEHYVNSLLSDLGNLIRNDVGMDFLISNVYQKMILQIGHPATIAITKRPKVVFLIGPTGVGKTTTLAKLASRFKIMEGKRVAFITSDTYRIAAEAQLTTYAKILEAPIEVLVDPTDLSKLVARYNEYDVVLVDTVGFSHKNTEQRENLKALLEALPEKYDRDIFLVLSATTKYRDLKAIVDEYKAFTEFALIFTKLDETDCFGNLYNIRKYAAAPLSYITTGQNVPEDISVVDSQRLVKNLLGGN